jgi:hypothetical protein
LTIMVAKFWAALLVCLCLLPTTAPFSTLDPVDYPAGPHSAPVIGTLTAAAFGTNADDNDALVIERLHRSQRGATLTRPVARAVDSGGCAPAIRVARALNNL